MLKYNAGVTGAQGVGCLPMTWLAVLSPAPLVHVSLGKLFKTTNCCFCLCYF